MSKISLSYHVHKKLRDLIISLKLRPGEPIIESKIANDLSVSRTPIREALIQLSKENLVTIISRKGAFVSSINPQNLENIFLVREALEGIAAGRAVNNITKNVLKELAILFEEAEASWNQNKIGPTIDEIHQVIIQFGGNALIQDILNNLDGQIKRFQSYALEISGRDKLSFTEHKEIFLALKTKDSKSVENAMRKHLMSTKKSLLSACFLNGNNRIYGATYHV